MGTLVDETEGVAIGAGTPDVEADLAEAAAEEALSLLVFLVFIMMRTHSTYLFSSTAGENKSDGLDLAVLRRYFPKVSCPCTNARLEIKPARSIYYELALSQYYFDFLLFYRT